MSERRPPMIPPGPARVTAADDVDRAQPLMTATRRRQSLLAAPGSPQRQVLARGLFLVAALLSFLLSIGLWFTGSRQEALFVGLWVPSILALGAFYFAGLERD